jgi:hypothetical protein
MNPETGEEFYERLAAVVVSRDSVPPEVVAAAKASFAWRTVEDDLAELVYDSAESRGVLSGVRGSSARQMTFERGDLAVELEVGGGSPVTVVGQVVPPQRVRIEIRHLDGSMYALADDLGRFDVASAPAGPVSLRFELESGKRVATTWVRL